jgi:flagellar protein FliO/FliZ
MIISLLSDAIDTSTSLLVEMDPANAASSVSSGDLGATFIKMMLTFSVLILLLFGTYWFIRRLIRMRLERGVGTASIQILEKKMISAKTMLYLIEVENKKVLLAESQLEVKRIEGFNKIDEN